MSARGSVLIACMLAAAGACSQSIEVLGPAEAQVRGGAGGASGPRDAQVAEPDASARDDAAVHEDGGVRFVPCDSGCGTGEVCAIDTCVPTAGIRSLDDHWNHACMVRDGRMYCWGNNDGGRLGVGDQEKRLAPARVGGDGDWLQVSVGEQQSCGLRSPGILYCWGHNDLGQLGVGDTEDRLVPARASSEDLYRRVECGGASCCAITRDGELDCWGDNLEGKIGQDDPYGSPNALLPLRVPELTVIDLTVGQGHVCAIRDDHTLWCWGRNSTVELGIGPDPIQVRKPVRVGDGANWLDVTASLHSTCGVRGDAEVGKVFCWGINPNLELGSPTLDEHVEMPRLVGSDADWRSVHAGWFHTCAIKGSGALYCWGRAIEGQLGQGGGEQPIAEPQLFERAASFERVALGIFNTLGVTREGALWSWGASDEDGALGTGDLERRYEPAILP